MKKKIIALLFLSSLLFFFACSVNKQATTEASPQAASSSSGAGQNMVAATTASSSSSSVVAATEEVQEKEGNAFGRKIGLFFSNLGEKIKMGLGKFGGLFSEEIKGFLSFLLIAIPVLLLLSFLYWLLFSGVLDNKSYTRRAA